MFKRHNNESDADDEEKQASKRAQVSIKITDVDMVKLVECESGKEKEKLIAIGFFGIPTSPFD